MERLKNEAIILSREGTNNLLNSLFHPNKDAIVRRDAFLEDFSRIEICEKDDGSVALDIPWLDLSENKETIANQPDCVIKDSLEQGNALGYDVFITTSKVVIEREYSFTSKLYMTGMPQDVYGTYSNANLSSQVNEMLKGAA